jgi:hypothetical protein
VQRNKTAPPALHRARKVQTSVSLPQKPRRAHVLDQLPIRPDFYPGNNLLTASHGLIKYCRGSVATDLRALPISMQMNTYNPYLALATIVLLPMVPAFLLFVGLGKALSTGDVQGKFRGWSIKLGGSFAGYFAIFIVIFWQSHIVFQPPTQEWDVVGRLFAPNGKPVQAPSPANFEIEPTMWSFDGQGGFSLRIPGDPVSPPTLSVCAMGCIEQKIDLKRYASIVSPETGCCRIDIPDIMLQAAPDYQPTAAMNEKPVPVNGN